MRLLITGSRSWKDYELLCACLDTVAARLANEEPDRMIKEGLTLVSGHAYGADAMCEGWFLSRFPLEEIEAHKAEWKKYNRRAGIVRNTEMVDSGPDACVAFIMPCDKDTCTRQPVPHGSHGAVHCSDYAETSGVPTSRFYGGGLTA